MLTPPSARRRQLLGAHGDVEGFAKRVLNTQLEPLRTQEPGVFVDDSSLSDSIREAMGAKQSVSCWPEGLGRIFEVTRVEKPRDGGRRRKMGKDGR